MSLSDVANSGSHCCGITIKLVLQFGKFAAGKAKQKAKSGQSHLLLLAPRPAQNIIKFHLSQVNSMAGSKGRRQGWSGAVRDGHKHCVVFGGKCERKTHTHQNEKPGLVFRLFFAELLDTRAVA